MDIQSEKLKLIELLLRTNSPSIISRIKEVFKSEDSSDIWEELSEQQKTDIDEALKDVAIGNIVSFDSFLEKHR